MNKKKGNISMTITLIISIAFLMVFAVYIIKMLTPMVWYQKMQNIANKYIYVVEKFGYLTKNEETELYKELQDEGFNTDNVILTCPKTRLKYGTLFEFELTYTIEQNYGVIFDGIKKETRNIPLHIKKYSYSKN